MKETLRGFFIGCLAVCYALLGMYAISEGLEVVALLALLLAPGAVNGWFELVNEVD